jgi:hypothetical protein
MSDWVCEKCGWNNPDQVVVCIVCGTKNELQTDAAKGKDSTSKAISSVPVFREFNKPALASFAFSLVIILIFFLQRILAQNIDKELAYLEKILFDLFCFIPPLSAIGSITTGIIALRQISYENEKGAWMARFGIVVGILEFILLILMFFATLLTNR